jgi:intraflagellar transport protein 122
MPDHQGQSVPIYSTCYSPDARQLLVAAKNHILVYNDKHELVQNIVTPHSTIYALSYSHDGKRFASAGSDRYVVVWSSKGKPLFKYPHTSAVFCLDFCPANNALLSGAAQDFGLFPGDDVAAEAKAVTKTKAGVTSRVLCCKWSLDGQLFALGLEDGTVLVRRQSGQEVATITRGGPVFSIDWSFLSPTRGTAGVFASVPAGDAAVAATAAVAAGAAPEPILAVTSWDKTVAFYRASGRPVGQSQRLPFLPLCVSYFDRYLLVGGTGNRVVLLSDSGIELRDVAHTDSWVWSLSVKPDPSALSANLAGVDPHTNTSAGAGSGVLTAAMSGSSTPSNGSSLPEFVLGCDDGRHAAVTVSVSIVHALHHAVYASREGCTDVMVRRLGSDATCRLSCGKMVERIACYRGLLAVHVSSPVRVTPSDSTTAASSSPSSPSAAVAKTDAVTAASVHDPSVALVGNPKPEDVLPREETILLYTVATSSPRGELQYRLAGRLRRRLDCALMCLSGHHLILCDDTRVTVLPLGLTATSGTLSVNSPSLSTAIAGHRRAAVINGSSSVFRNAGDSDGTAYEQQWTLPTPITYVRVVGGLPGHECVLVGLSNGEVHRIFIGHRFSSLLYVHPSALALRQRNASTQRTGKGLTSGVSNGATSSSAGAPAAGQLAIRCADLNCDRTLVAVVDGSGVCAVFPYGAAETAATVVEDVSPESSRQHGMTGSISGRLTLDFTPSPPLYTLPNTAAAAWNSDIPELLAVSGSSKLRVSLAGEVVFSQPTAGFVIGFTGRKAFSFRRGVTNASDIPMSSAVRHLMAKGDLRGARTVSSLGVPDSDWKALGREALLSGDFDTARKAFLRLRNVRGLELIDSIRRAGGAASSSAVKDLARAEILASEGQFAEAAQVFVRAGSLQRASDLLFFAPPSQLSAVRRALTAAAGPGAASLPSLLRQQAETLQAAGEWDAAAEAWVSAGLPARAASIIADHSPDAPIQLFRLAQSLPLETHGFGAGQSRVESSATVLAASDVSSLAGLTEAAVRDALEVIRDKLLDAGHVDSALTVCTKLGDVAGIAAVNVALRRWKPALALAQSNPDLAPVVYAPYASYLASKGKFAAARKWFTRAGTPHRGLALLGDLALAAATEGRFADAAAHAVSLAHERAAAFTVAGDSTSAQRLFADMLRRAKAYTAFASVTAASSAPFSVLPAQTVLQACLAVFEQSAAAPTDKPLPPGVFDDNAPSSTPFGVCPSLTVHALVRYAVLLGATRLAVSAAGVAASSVPPTLAWANELETLTLRLRARQQHDDEQLLHVCRRCGTSQPLRLRPSRPVAPSLPEEDRSDPVKASAAILIASAPSVCVTCSHPIYRCGITFTQLPLVAFTFDRAIAAKPGINTAHQALAALVQAPVPPASKAKARARLTSAVGLDATASPQPQPAARPKRRNSRFGADAFTGAPLPDADAESSFMATGDSERFTSAPSDADADVLTIGGPFGGSGFGSGNFGGSARIQGVTSSLPAELQDPGVVSKLTSLDGGFSVAPGQQIDASGVPLPRGTAVLSLAELRQVRPCDFFAPPSFYRPEAEDAAAAAAAGLPIMPPFWLHNMDPDLAMSQCPHCSEIFLADEFASAQIRYGVCPVCRR